MFVAVIVETDRLLLKRIDTLQRPSRHTCNKVWHCYTQRLYIALSLSYFDKQEVGNLCGGDDLQLVKNQQHMPYGKRNTASIWTIPIQTCYTPENVIQPRRIAIRPNRLLIFSQQRFKTGKWIVDFLRPAASSTGRWSGSQTSKPLLSLFQFADSGL